MATSHESSAGGLPSVPEVANDDISASLFPSPSRNRRNRPRPGSPKSPPRKASSPFAPANLFRRAAYHRVNSDGTHDMLNQETPQQNPPSHPTSPSLDPRTPFSSTSANGVDDLGISMSTFHHHRSSGSIPRVAVGSKRGFENSPKSQDHLLGSETPLSTPWDDPPPSEDRISPHDPYLEEPEPLKSSAGPISGASDMDLPGPYLIDRGCDDGDVEHDVYHDKFDDDDFLKGFGEPPSYCRYKNDIYKPRRSWLAIVIIVLSVYSTLMSGIWLAVAIRQVRWGHRISSSKGLQPSTATLLAALTSKTIEMSFVTVFITFLGQTLTRRSFLRKSQGMTLAEMTMRNWVVLPGSLLTHFETIKSAAPTFLGALSLVATLAAMFYTTASDAMVSPKLKYGEWEHRLLSGHFRASYANADYCKETCPSVYPEDRDGFAQESCMNVEFSGQSYRNLLSYMSVWTTINENGTGISQNIADRPPGTMMLYQNTTLTGSWIETEHSNVTAHYESEQRIINNVTLALPHPGVYKAAQSPLNNILQPADLAGVGEYAIKAGVVSPAINAMCVNMSPKDLAPLVYTEWPEAADEGTSDFAGWGGDVPHAIDSDGNPDYLNSTEVDDIFRWGEKYQRRPPVFPLYPSDYNTLVNSTVYQSDSIYILGKSPTIADYTLCQLRSWVSPNCTTHFNISGTGGASMGAHCEDPNDKHSYIHSCAPDTQFPGPSHDWRWIGMQWQLSMTLNGGISKDNASNARILTQLALAGPELLSYLPSMAEALAVYASSTAVMSAMDTPFIHYWKSDKKGNTLGPPGNLQAFNASLITQQYTSGHQRRWQGIFYAVLAVVFIINLFCLGYWWKRCGLVTDFTEPQNVFALALNSPPSAQIYGSCGGGPEGGDLAIPWRVGYAPSAKHYFFKEVQQAKRRSWRWGGEGGRRRRPSVEGGVGATTTTRTMQGGRYGIGHPGGPGSYKRLSSTRGWLP